MNVGELKEFLKDVPDDAEIFGFNEAFVKMVPFSLKENIMYESKNNLLFLNAESKTDKIVAQQIAKLKVPTSRELTEFRTIKVSIIFSGGTDKDESTMLFQSGVEKMRKVMAEDIVGRINL